MRRVGIAMNPHVCRDIRQPLHTTGLEADVRVEVAAYRAGDDGLQVLRQPLDQRLLGEDVAREPPVHVVEATDEGGLLCEGWEHACQGLSVPPVELLLKTSPKAVEALLESVGVKHEIANAPVETIPRPHAHADVCRGHVASRVGTSEVETARVRLQLCRSTADELWLHDLIGLECSGDTPMPCVCGLHHDPTVPSRQTRRLHQPGVRAMGHHDIGQAHHPKALAPLPVTARQSPSSRAGA